MSYASEGKGLPESTYDSGTQLS